MIRELFNQCATKYDQDRPKLVPCFHEFYGTAMRVIPFSAEKPIHVLDIGAGTGLFANMILQAFSPAKLHLTDISEAMLDQARLRFAGNPIVTYSVQDHLNLGATSEYDLVVSALSIHHIGNCDKQILFQKIYSALRPGGMFINADQALAPTTHGESQYESIWLQDVRANGISELALKQASERMREDKNALLSDQINWLLEAGFSDIDCWYKRFRFVVYGGIKRIVPVNPADPKDLATN